MEPTGDDYQAAIAGYRLAIDSTPASNRIAEHNAEVARLVLDQIEELAAAASRERRKNAKPREPHYPNSACEARG